MYASCYSDSSDDSVLFTNVTIPNQVTQDVFTETSVTLNKTIIKSNPNKIEKEFTHHIDTELTYCFCCNEDSVCNWEF